jgi:F0F1-type ATP synthase assembly protein I
MMEKTWEIREKEIREEIAQRIEDELEGMLPPVDDTEIAVYHAMTWVIDFIRGKV